MQMGNGASVDHSGIDMNANNLAGAESTQAKEHTVVLNNVKCQKENAPLQNPVRNGLLARGNRSSASLREQIKLDRLKFAKKQSANACVPLEQSHQSTAKPLVASTTSDGNMRSSVKPAALKHAYLKRFKHKQPDKIIKCPLNCGSEYKDTKSALKRHERSCPNFPVRCHVSSCKETVLRGQLDQHMALKHRRSVRKNSNTTSSEKPWHKKNRSKMNPKLLKNAQCTKIFIAENHLNGNKDTERPISTEDCVRLASLKAHNKNIGDTLAKVLVHPTFLEYNHICDCLKLIKYTSKELIDLYENNKTSTYAAASASLASSHGLFLPTERSGRVEWKKFFHNNLWPSRKKWMRGQGYCDANEEEAQFKISVATRFRPGERSKSRLSLPLHQFLKMRRLAKDGTMPVLGEKTKIPDHFKDDFTGVLMHSPIQLPSSRKFMDRKVLQKSLRVDPHDPFDGSPLSPSKIIECPALKQEIQKHVKEINSLSQDDKDMKVSMAAVQTMAQTDGETLTSDMVEALMDAERLERAIEKAERKSKEASRNTNSQLGSTLDGGVGDGAVIASQYTGLEDSGDNNTGMEQSDSQFTTRLDLSNDLQSNGTKLPVAKSSSSKDNGINAFQRKKDQARVISVLPNRINMYVPGAGVRPFTFSRCFDEKTSQSELYLETGRNVVLSALNGFNSALLTYGQTGSGKTYTIYGGEGWVEKTSTEIESNKPLTICGIAVRAMTDIFDSKASMKSKNINMNITVQYVQIYNDEVYDLGTGNPVTLRKSNGQLLGASQFNVDGVRDFFSILRTGEEFKHYAETKMNHRSSRAHTILIVTLTQNKSGTDSLITSQLQMVDLAGSERIKRSQVVGNQRVEAVGINYSLLCLGKVIKSLVEDSTTHVPYFESKLTTLLKGAFGGNSITSAIITCRMNDENAAETLQALYFGERCSMITNTTRNAVVSKDAALQTIDQALQTCKSGLQRLEERGKQHLNVYKELVARSQNLQIKRNALLL